TADQLEAVMVDALGLLRASAHAALAGLRSLDRHLHLDQRGAGRARQGRREEHVVVLLPAGGPTQGGERSHQVGAVSRIGRIRRARSRLLDDVAGGPTRGATRERSIRLIEADAHPERAGAVDGPVAVARRIAVGAGLRLVDETLPVEEGGVVRVRHLELSATVGRGLAATGDERQLERAGECGGEPYREGREARD